MLVDSTIGLRLKVRFPLFHLGFNSPHPLGPPDLLWTLILSKRGLLWTCSSLSSFSLLSPAVLTLRVLSYVVNEVAVNGLANSPAFQRFAVRTNKKMQNLSKAAAETKLKDITEQMKDFSRIVQEVKLGGQEMKKFGLFERFLCTGAKSSGASNGGNAASSSSAVMTESSEGNSSSGENSGDGEKSQGSEQQSGDAGKSVRGSPVSWMSLFLLLVTGGGIVYYYDREKKRHIEEISNASNAVRQGPSVGQAAIGGPFNLINHEGKNVTDKDFLGKWTVFYFGFTHCPDICPDELQKLAAGIDKIKEKSGLEIVPVFISVDPERDTVEQVSEYVKEFHPKLIGLTGDSEEIRKVARAYRVYYMKTTEEGSDYLVDHSIVMYLMSPEMKFVKFFGKNNDVDGLANGIINEVKQYKR